MFSILLRSIRSVSFVFLCCAVGSAVSAQTKPSCVSQLSDPDGDGFGWENGQSCRVVPTAIGSCLSAGSDPDGDGFGWENGKSCRVKTTDTNTRPVCLLAASDPDGDGFGWEDGRTCVVTNNNEMRPEERFTLRHPACSQARYDADNDGYGWENSTTCTSRTFGDEGAGITDLILVTGQSNALGAETIVYDESRYDETLDSPVKRAYAYTNFGWTIAGLRQIWDRNWYPRSDITNDPANNFAFHFAKHVVKDDPSRVVGIVLVTAPGQAIAHWDKDGGFYRSIESRVISALNALPHKNRIDAVLWHQGETDYYDTQYYGGKLNALIDNLRAEWWVQSDAAFICGETLNSPVNARLNRLNTDGDDRTGCVSAAGLESVGDGVHFSADSLRELGARYAEKYLEISGR